MEDREIMEGGNHGMWMGNHGGCVGNHGGRVGIMGRVSNH